MRHVLQMLVHLVAHVKNDALRDPRVDVVLEHTDQLAHGQRRERGKQELYKELHVPADQRLVHDTAGYDRRKESDGRRQQYRDEHEDELQPVRFQITHYPGDQFPRHLRHILFFFLCEEVHRAHAARSRSCHYLPFSMLSATAAALLQALRLQSTDGLCRPLRTYQ